MVSDRGASVMATIDETIKNYIEMLSCEVDSSDEKGDSQQETQSLLDFHLWCLLQNKGLIEIVKVMKRVLLVEYV